MKKRKKNRAERTRKKRAQREEKRNGKGTRTMAEKKIVTEDQIHTHMEKGEYAQVINAFAAMLEQGNPPEECFGDVARAYFELGDYTRAANWVTATLSRDAGNIDARILLARICQREKRVADALRVYENIIAVHGKALTDAQRAEIGRRAGLDARLSPEKTRAEYPYLAALLGLGEAPAKTPAVPPSAASPAVAAAPAAAPQSAAPATIDAQRLAAEILAQGIRPSEKVHVLNAFASAAYVADDFAGAKHLLTEALRLDPGCDGTLKNMALLLHSMGKKDQAIQIAATMRQADFILLRMLKA